MKFLVWNLASIFGICVFLWLGFGGSLGLQAIESLGFIFGIAFSFWLGFGVRWSDSFRVPVFKILACIFGISISLLVWAFATKRSESFRVLGVCSLHLNTFDALFFLEVIYEEHWESNDIEIIDCISENFVQNPPPKTPSQH